MLKPRCVYLCVAHQSQCLCQQKDLSRLEEMAWKDSNDLSSLTFPYGADFSPSVLVVLSATLLPFCFLNLSVHTLFQPSKFSLAIVPHLAVFVCSGGRGVVVGPIVSQSLSDVFCDNEYGPNFLFRNNGDGTFTDVAQQSGERNMVVLTRQDFVNLFT